MIPLESLIASDPVSREIPQGGRPGKAYSTAPEDAAVQPENIGRYGVFTEPRQRRRSRYQLFLELLHLSFIL